MNKKNIAIVLAGNIENAPYHAYYTKIFDKVNAEYEIITWDRLTLGAKGTYCFRYPSPDNLPFYKKLTDFYRFSKFVKKILSNKKYNYVVVFTLVNIVFLGKFLIKNYSNRYILDIRDYSPLLPFVRRRLKKIFNHAMQITVSSKGYSHWLPEKYEYVLCHNISYENLCESKSFNINLNKPVINIISFGLIRDHEVYKRLFIDLANSEKYKIKIIGAGIEPLQNFVKENKIRNVFFGGRYNKDEEKVFLKEADFIFIMLPRSIAHDGIMSNRFYHAIVNHKPMIVNDGNIQSSFVHRFGLGVIINPDDNILQKLNTFITEFNPEAFNEGCLNMLQAIKIDMDSFENNLTAILSK